MEFWLFLAFLIVVLFYLFKPVTEMEKKNFTNKNNWRGGF